MTDRLLVVDWDFFIDMSDEMKQPWLYDWGHRESNFFKGPVWWVRAQSFDLAEVARPTTTEDWPDFWDRFGVVDADFYYADSNREAGRLIPDSGGWDEVWLYDAHHDCGYDFHDAAEVEATGRYECGSWMVAHHLRGSELHVRYPKWKTYAFDVEPEMEVKIPVDRAFDDGLELPGDFTSVFVCRSGAWTPPWCDDDFAEFLSLFPGWQMECLDDEVDEPRQWSEASVAVGIEQMKQLRARGGDAVG